MIYIEKVFYQNSIMSNPTTRKKLYVASSIEELQKKAYVAPTILTKAPKLLRNSLSEVKKKAEQSYQDGDEEMSYCYYFKLTEIIMTLSNSKEGDHLHFRKLYGQDLIEFIKIMESLQSSLSSRYTYRREENNENEVSERTEDLKSRESATQKEIIMEEIQTASPDWISCRDLYGLINNNNENVIIFDARPALHFAESHVKSPLCVNIPEDILRPGVTANNLTKELPESSVNAWIKRTKTKNLVLYDWDSAVSRENDGRKAIAILKDAITKWDPNEIYECNPVILDGGFNKWRIYYPSVMTHSLKRRTVTPGLHKVELDYGEVTYDIEPLYEKQKPLPAKEEALYESPRLTPSPPPISVPLISIIPFVINKEVPIPNEVPRKPVIDRKRKPETRTYLSLTAGEEISDNKVNKEHDNNDEDNTNDNNVQMDTKPSFDRSQKPDPRKNEEWERIRAEKERKADEEMRMNMERPQKTLPSENLENKSKEDEEKRKQEVERIRAIRMKKEEAIRQEAQREAEMEKKILNDQQESEKDQRIETMPLTPRTYSLIKTEETGEGKRLTLKLYKKDSSQTNGTKTDSGMRRSFSSPNIAQERGLSGLKNLGNTCYMNSIIQCLSNTPNLAKFFLEQGFKDVNFKQNEITQSFSSVIKQLWLGSEKFISCKELKIAAGRHHADFNGNNQQDSHEFLVYLLDWLHEAMKGCKPVPELANLENYSDEEAAEISWTHYYKKQNTIIRNLFCGLQKSSLRCIICGHTSATFDIFYVLSLPIPNGAQDCGLQDCLDRYFEGERICDWKCPVCKHPREAIKKFDLCKLPPVLIIHLKRFSDGGRSVQKVQKRVNFPLADLHLQASKDSASYSLCGISNHWGTLDCGHYTSFCWNGVHEGWFRFDDCDVSPVEDRKSLNSSAAYILFYSTKDLLEKEHYPS